MSKERKNRLYIACSWFTKDQLAIMNKGYEELKKNPTVDWENSYRPLDHQYNGWSTITHPELLQNKEWQIATYNNDILGIRRCDVAVFLYNEAEVDDGQGFEMGFARALQKQVILVTKDKKAHKPVNLMLAIAPDHFLTLDELATYNFNSIEHEFYGGEVF